MTQLPAGAEGAEGKVRDRSGARLQRPARAQVQVDVLGRGLSTRLRAKTIGVNASESFT